MFKLIVILLFTSFESFAIDIGTGADGACSDVAVLNANDSGPYNCSSLTINGDFSFNAENGVDPVVIKVTGHVTITFGNTLSVNGGDGGPGTFPPAFTEWGKAGRGGDKGGDTHTNSTQAGLSGSGTGGGGAGGLGDGAAFTLGTGGGGGGGRFNGAASPGIIGQFLAGGTAGAAGAAGSLSYNTETNFTNLFIGGSGGGAGGPGENSGAIPNGASGGGGGGAIHIMAGGDITIAGAIEANGGNGGNGHDFSGGGGGGSGGAIFLEALGNVDISGSVSAVKGTGGSGSADVGTDPNDGDGGDGGTGRIRIDDADGNYTGVGPVTPAAYEAVVSSLSSTDQATRLDSSIACGSVALVDDDHNNFISMLLGVISLSFMMIFIRRLKFKTYAKQNSHFT